MQHVLLREQNNLAYLRFGQCRLCTHWDCDALLRGEVDAVAVGERTILLASLMGPFAARATHSTASWCAPPRCTATSQSDTSGSGSAAPLAP